MLAVRWRRAPQQQREAGAAGGWDAVPLELAVLVVRCLEEQRDRRAAHLVSRTWREAVRLATSYLAPRSLDTARIKEAFPRVTDLDLRGLVLTPQDMLRLGGLHRLATLRLLRCTLEHPASLLALAGLAQLQCLELQGVAGARPAVIDDLLPSLTGLQALKVEGCAPHGLAPSLKHLSALGALRQLSIQKPSSAPQASVPGLAHLASLGCLQDLCLEGAPLTDELAAGLAGHSALTRLLAPGALSLSNAGLQHLCGLTALRELDLSLPEGRTDDGLMTDSSVAALSGMQRLSKLSLAGRARITAAGLLWLRSCTELQHLDLRLVDLWEADDFLSKLTQLTLLRLGGTPMPPYDPHLLFSLLRLTALKELDVSQRRSMGVAVGYLTPLTGLTSLDLSGCGKVSSESLKRLRTLPLRRLLLDGCQVSMTGVMGILLAHRGVALWHASRDRTPRFLNVLRAVIVAQPEPRRSQLRVRFAPEGHALKALLAWSCVAAFAVGYSIALLCALASLVVLPLLGLIGAMVIRLATLTGPGAKQNFLQRLAQRGEQVMVALLAGLQAVL